MIYISQIFLQLFNCLAIARVGDSSFQQIG